MAEKMRVHTLAKELNVPSKTIIDKCRAEGIDSVKNHMSTLSAGLTATIMEWFSEESVGAALETAEPIDLQKVRIRKRVAKKADPELQVEDEHDEVSESAVSAGDGEMRRAAAEASSGSATATSSTATIEAEPEQIEQPAEEPEPEDTAPVAETPPSAAQDQEPPAVAAEVPPPVAAQEAVSPPSDVPTEPAAAEEAPGEVREPVRPAGPQHVPTPAKLQGPRVVRYEAPDHDAYVRRPRPRAAPVGEGTPTPAVDTPDDKKAAAEKAKQGRRAKLNPRRAAGRMAEAGERLQEWRDRDLLERQERLQGATGRRIVRRRVTSGGGGKQAASGPITEATVHEPVRMKEFCSATGLSFMQLFKVMRDELELVPNINMVLPNDTAQLLASQFDIDLTVVPAKTRLDELQDEFAARERQNLQPRPTVVTILGHVDHGKTSLLDRIRKAHVAAEEDGGITQHISSYHIRTPHGAVTFVDTPGHEAFTEMRARGAQVTDVVVLVVAADDGVMPQTVEAINHAKAAGVPIVVALNKIDLGDQNKLKIYGQLTEQGLTPSGDWGGEVDVLETSATTGRGVDELVEHLAALSSILDLKADPKVPAMGTVLEAETKTGVGAVAQILVTEGTLRVGDIVVCGNASGKVRAMLDDRGRRLEEAGPAIPIELWGLDDVPSSGDKLYQLDSPQRAKDIATETKSRRQEDARIGTRKMQTLAEMLHRRDSDEVPELNVIIKADVDGSLSALKQTLMEIPSDEVKLSIRHAAVGAVNDSDVLLAATCEGVVIAFRVDTNAGAKRLAENHGVEVRNYRVIYDVHDEVKKALEGLLAPDVSLENRGRAEVREVFKLSRRAGTIAGCYVQDGVIERKHLAKVIRDGAIIRDSAQIGSLRRFKDDVREVRAGLECGIKIEGFDDLKQGDIVETYEVIHTARTL